MQLMGGMSLSFYDWYCDLPNASPETWGEQTDVQESADWFNAKLLAVLRLLVAILRVSGFSLVNSRLPDGEKKTTLLLAVKRTRSILPLRAVLRILRVSPTRYHRWKRSHEACSLDDSSSCPKSFPQKLTPEEVRSIKEMVTSTEYRHVPTGTLAVLAQRLGRV